MNGKRPATGSQSMAKAFAVLSAFTLARPRRRGSDIARELGLSESTVSRVLAGLEAVGFVERDPESGLHHLGLWPVQLATISMLSREIVHAAMPRLATLTQELGVTSNLGVMHEDQVYSLATFSTPKLASLFALPGIPIPVHSTAMGAVLAAYLPHDQREQMLRRLTYRRYTANTVTSAEAFRAKLQGVRARGFAVDREESGPGCVCIAVPVFGADGTVIAACGISALSTQRVISARGRQTITRVIEQAGEISRSLRYVPAQSAGLADAGPSDEFERLHLEMTEAMA